jgi:hypothetical protein
LRQARKERKEERAAKQNIRLFRPHNPNNSMIIRRTGSVSVFRWAKKEGRR